MSLRALALDWRFDPSAAALLAQLAAVATLYLVAVTRRNKRDRRGRRWPRRYTLAFLAGLTTGAIDLCSGIGSQADSRLSAHMLEHMVLWLIVAPLLAAGAPVRLAFYSFSAPGRRRLARCLRSRAIAGLTNPVGAVSLFSAAIVITHLPPVYGLALSNEFLHEAEHGLYLLTALLVWAPLIGVDPIPHRPGIRGQFACTLACMLPMMLVALWLASAPEPLYDHYVVGSASAALQDQRLAATIMWAAGLPAFALPALQRLRLPLRGHRQQARTPSTGVSQTVQTAKR
jgi:cytochrome c oxidase assembly factor CtaG